MAPLTVCGGKPNPKGTRLLRARVGQTPKDTPYCVRGSLRRVRPHLRFGLVTPKAHVPPRVDPGAQSSRLQDSTLDPGHWTPPSADLRLWTDTQLSGE